MPRQASYHHPNLREALLEAAARELEEKGLEEVSLRGIAARAGVSHTAPYRHFESKEDLLGQLLLESSERFSTAMREAYAASDPTDPVGAILALGDAYADFAQSHPHEIALMFSSVGTALLHQQVACSDSIDRDKHDSFETLEKACAAYLGGVSRSRPKASRPQPTDLAIVVWSIAMGQARLERERLIEGMGQARNIAPGEMRKRIRDALVFLLTR